MKTVKPPGRNAYARITHIHRLISAKRYPNVPYLAERIEVSRKTIERDIEKLRDFFGAPIEYDHHKKGYYYREPFELPHVKLTEGEALESLVNCVVISIYLRHFSTKSSKE